MTLALPTAHAAEGQVPPWLEPEVIRASLAIQLTEAQQPEFRRIVGHFITERVGMIRQEVQKNRSGTTQNAIKRKTRKLAGEMDDEMKPVLQPEQWPAYEIYRDTLLDNLRG